jgi:hypothetical protein
VGFDIDVGRCLVKVLPNSEKGPSLCRS